MTEILTTLPEPPLFRGEQHIEPVPPTPTPLTLIQVAFDKGMDPRQMEKLFDLQERHERNVAAESFATALAQFQARCPMITKRRKIDLGGGSGPLYAGLDDIMREIGPLLAECALSVTFSADLDDTGRLRAACNIRHGRHVETSHVTLPAPTQMRVNDTQKMGAALSYAKRYALCAALNITVTDEDNDANGMATTITPEQVAILDEWLTSTNTPAARFLKWAGVQNLCDLPASRFDEAIGFFKRKAGTK